MSVAEAVVYVVYVKAPCGFEPEVLGSADCRARPGADGDCRYICVSKRPFYVRLSFDTPYWYSRPAALEAYLQLLLTC